MKQIDAEGEEDKQTQVAIRTRYGLHYEKSKSRKLRLGGSLALPLFSMAPFLEFFSAFCCSLARTSPCLFRNKIRPYRRQVRPSRLR